MAGQESEQSDLDRKTGDLNREREFSRIISSYLSAVDAGEKPDRAAILKENPELADRLKSYFAGEDELGAFEAPTRPASLTEDDETRAGEEIGDYELLDEIARGGMGVVYRARQKSLKRLVALKMIVGGHLANEEIVSRFHREAEAVARLDHPNVVPIYEIGEHEGQHYFSMKLFEGGSLLQQREHFRDHPRAAAGMIKTVAWAVHYAHLSGILHRDLKPANILLDSAGRPHIADFGLARAIAGEASLSLTDTGAILGTPLYMAPEQATGDKSRWGPAMDIYSLGAMLYEFLTGRPPFRGKTPVDILRAVIEDDPPPARSVNPKTPHDLETICTKCLEKDPSKRYESAAALADDLDRFLRHETIRARPPGLVRRVGKAAVRHRVATAAILVALTAGLVFGAVAWYQAERTFDEALESARASLERNDLEEAEKGLHHLQEAYGDRSPVVGIAIELCRRLRSRGTDRLNEYLEQAERVIDLKEGWEHEKGKSRLSQPPWERRGEIDAWNRYETARKGVEEYYNAAVQLLRTAQRIASGQPAELDVVNRSLAELFLDKYEEANRLGAATVSPEFFKKEIQALNLPELNQRLEGRGTVSFETDPPGAEVYCFRYENYEERLLPLPFDPRAGAEDSDDGLLGAPYLEIEAVGTRGLSPFEPGDRWMTVNGHAVGQVGELADLLREVDADETVEVTILRGGEEETVAWTPYPKDRFADGPERFQPGRIVSLLDQFDLSFSGYPLDFADGCRVGVSQEGSPLNVELPRGSYLFVFRKDGYRDTRYPVAMPRTVVRDQVRLLEESEIPSGFVYIPAGSFSCGGDKDAFQSMDADYRHVDGFFLGRYEVTIGEYLEFLNDPETLARTNTKGMAIPVVESTREILVRRGRSGLRIVPRGIYQPVATGWEAKWNKDLPVVDVPQMAALEYAHWLTEKEGKGWRYRLPTDLEWEKAARGVDRRKFVWGNYPFWTYCWTCRSVQYRSVTEKCAVALPGTVSTDESVYGVRDLAGSVAEVTVDKPWKTELLYRSIRGGDWYHGDESYLHAATRNGFFPYNSEKGNGFRLAADLKPGPTE